MRLLIFALVFVTQSFAIQYDLPKIRKAYEQAAKDETTAKNLLIQVEALSSNNTLMLAYKGAITMILAKFQLNPFSKLSYFNKGKTILEQAIAKENNNLEIIYLRYAIQSNVPSFLDYKKNMDSDKRFLLNTIHTSKDKDLNVRIINFLKASGNLSAAEYKLLY